jgi:hypothetical protein
MNGKSNLNFNFFAPFFAKILVKNPKSHSEGKSSALFPAFYFSLFVTIYFFSKKNLAPQTAERGFLYFENSENYFAVAFSFPAEATFATTVFTAFATESERSLVKSTTSAEAI